MKKIASLVLVAFAVLVWACGNSLKDDPQVKEAGKLHLEASEIQEEIEPLVEQIDSVNTALAEKKKTLADSSAQQAEEVIAALSKVKTDFEDWEKNVFEVPGVEHNHAEGEEHHHHHDHKPAPDLTPEQMLEVQKEMLKTIQGLKEAVNQNMTKAKTLLQ
ncbi:MAG: hypothetical protein U0Y10_22925 [Spirosomataceae bacterium]